MEKKHRPTIVTETETEKTVEVDDSMSHFWSQLGCGGFLLLLALAFLVAPFALTIH